MLTSSQKLSIATLGFIITTLWAYHIKDNFWIVTYGYVLTMYIMATTSYSERLRKILKKTIWVAFALSLIVGFYANHYYPHGEYIDTGDVICKYDGRGPCQESYIEDVSDLDVPAWVKFFHTSSGKVAWLALLFAGIIISNKSKVDEQISRIQ